MITLQAIAIRTKRGAPMQEHQQINVSTDKGLQDDAGRKPGRFMVTILSEEAWQDACAEVNTSLPWTTRRANLLIRGYRFSADDVGKVLSIGDCQLKITRETDPCDLMEAACPGLKKALSPDWRGGVRAQVIQAGKIAIGDKAVISQP